MKTQISGFCINVWRLGKLRHEAQCVPRKPLKTPKQQAMEAPNTEHKALVQRVQDALRLCALQDLICDPPMLSPTGVSG